MGATHYTKAEKAWLLKFSEEHRKFKTDLVIGKLYEEYHKQPGFTERTDRGLLAQYEKACRDIKVRDARILEQIKVEKEQPQQQSTKGLQGELAFTGYDDGLLYQDVIAMVNGSITAMRRAKVIAHAIKDPGIRATAEDLIVNFWN